MHKAIARGISDPEKISAVLDSDPSMVPWLGVEVFQRGCELGGLDRTPSVYRLVGEVRKVQCQHKMDFYLGKSMNSDVSYLCWLVEPLAKVNSVDDGLFRLRD